VLNAALAKHSTELFEYWMFSKLIQPVIEWKKTAILDISSPNHLKLRQLFDFLRTNLIAFHKCKI